MNIFLVDRNEKFRESLRLYLEGHLHHNVVGEVPDEKFLGRFVNLMADVVLVDVNAAIKKSSLNDVCTNLGKCGCRVIALSQHKEMVDASMLRDAGFNGFVSKENLFRDLEDAIREVASGGFFYPDESQN